MFLPRDAKTHCKTYRKSKRADGKLIPRPFFIFVDFNMDKCSSISSIGNYLLRIQIDRRLFSAGGLCVRIKKTWHSGPSVGDCGARTSTPGNFSPTHPIIKLYFQCSLNPPLVSFCQSPNQISSNRRLPLLIKLSPFFIRVTIGNILIFI